MRTTTLPLRFIVVAAAHVGLFYIVNDALRFDLKPDIERHTDVTFIPEKPDPLVGRPQPRRQHETITVRPDKPPQPIYEDPEDEASGPDASQPVKHGGGSGPDAGEIVARFVPVRADADYPLTRAAYPVASIRLEEQGVVELAIHVLRDGRIAAVRVAKSSGYPRLDRAAVDEARRNWRLQPAMQGDVRVDGWGSFRVVFRLDGRS